MRQLIVGLFVVVAVSATAQAYFLDGGRRFDVRLRTYSQVGIMATSYEGEGFDRHQYDYRSGDVGQWRNFYNPEFDAKLTDFTRWMGDVRGLSVIAPEDLKFRFAWWGFYDGIYDVLDGGWNDNRRGLKGRFSQTDDPYGKSFAFNDENKNARHIYASRNRINELYVDYTKDRFFFRVGRQAISWGEADTIALLDVSNPFDLTLGAPGFFQDVDEARIPLWTLRSTVKLVDNWKWMSSLFADAYLVPGPIDTTVPINPITGGLSPFNPDVGDPLNNLILRNQLTGGVVVNAVPAQHVSTVDKLPENTWHNSRWGARLTGVVARDYTVQGWFFRTFNQAPVPHLLVPPGVTDKVQVDNRGFRVPVCTPPGPSNNFTSFYGRTPDGRPCKRARNSVTVLDRQLESVLGLASTWFSPWANGIIRTEAEYFINELAFIPQDNLNPRSQLPSQVQGNLMDLFGLDKAAAKQATQGVLNGIGHRYVGTSQPKADFLRFLIGYDRFFFFRPLNPTNSFVLSTAFNGSINLSERNGRDFRNPNPKPSSDNLQTAIARAPVEPRPIRDVSGCHGQQAYNNPLCVKIRPKNFEDLYKFEGFLQTALQTDYMHGRLSPRLVIITDVSGIFAFQPSATFRFTDYLLGSLAYLAIESTGRRSGIATFKGHDMVQARVTYQLN